MSSRIDKINSEIHKQLANIIEFEMSDPRVKNASVVRTETTKDLRYCKVYISVLGTDEEFNAAVAALNTANGFIRSELVRAVKLRIAPELAFIKDDSISYSAHLSKILGEIKK